MTIEVVFVIWQCVHITLSMCGLVELTNMQIFFPSVCFCVTIAFRVFFVMKQRKYRNEIDETLKEIKKLTEEFDKIYGKKDD